MCELVRIKDKAGEISVVSLEWSQLCELLGDWKAESKEQKRAFWNGEISIDCEQGNIKLVNKALLLPKNIFTTHNKETPCVTLLQKLLCLFYVYRFYFWESI